MTSLPLLDSRLKQADINERKRLYGPEPDNPFRVLREANGYTYGDLAAYSAIDRRALQRIEYGMYVRPLPKLVDFWISKQKTTEGQLLSEYEDYQLVQRRRHFMYFGDNRLRFDLSNSRHPFRQLRSKRPSLLNWDPLPVGLTECCQALCLPLDTIQFFEKKWRTQKSVPKVLKAALNECGYIIPAINDFESNYKKWREKHGVVVSHG